MLSHMSETTPDKSEILHLALHSSVIPGLNAMRAIAITMVVFYHMGFPFSGQLGVIIFFVLSGFLITSILLKELRDTGTISLRKFYRARAYRIFPAFYTFFVLALILMVLQHQPIHWWQEASSFFYVSNYARAALPLAGRLNFPMSHTWSLAVEEQFYMLWPMALLWIATRRRSAIAFVGSAILAIWIWRAVVLFTFKMPMSILPVSYACNAFDTRADALLIGGLIAIVAFGGNTNARAALCGLLSPWLAIASLIVLAFSNRFDVGNHSNLITYIFNFSLEPVFTGIVLIQWVFLGYKQWHFLEHAAIKFVARISYSIYLYHLLALEILIPIPIPHIERIIKLPLILALACASYYLVERPFMRIRDRRRSKNILLANDLAGA